MDTIEYATFRYDTVEVENGPKAGSAAILKRYCCHGNVTYKNTLTTIRLSKCSSI